MGALSKTFLILSATALLCGGANAGERGREARATSPLECTQYKTDGTCTTLAGHGDKFCIADGRCSAGAPRPVWALIRYDAKMDALR